MHIYANTVYNFLEPALREKCLYSEFFLSVFSRIWIERGEIRSISLIQSECGKIQTRKTPTRGTFHVVRGF